VGRLTVRYFAPTDTKLVNEIERLLAEKGD